MIHSRSTSLSGIALAALAVLLVFPTIAGSHYVVSNPSQRPFYFDAATYTKHGDQYKVSDPINLTFLTWDQRNGFTASEDNVKLSFADDYDRKGRDNTMEQSNCLHLATDEYMIFRAFKKYNGVHLREPVLRDYQMTDGSVQGSCMHEYHIRWWKDWVHADITGRSGSTDPHGLQDQWAIGAAHHENRGFVGKHHIDRDWYLVKRQMIWRMRSHCTQQDFLYDAAADGPFQGYISDGWIGMISEKTKSLPPAGC